MTQSQPKCGSDIGTTDVQTRVGAVAKAQRIVAAFRAHPGAGVVSLDGIMLDAPHLKAAEHVIARGTMKAALASEVFIDRSHFRIAY